MSNYLRVAEDLQVDLLGLQQGDVYKVKHRTFRTFNNSKVVTAKREFLGVEMRFGSIKCYLFTSRVTKKFQLNPKIISIPYYDLLEVLN